MLAAKRTINKWLLCFAGALFFSFLLIAAINYIVDPYGAFGGKFFYTPTYDFSKNQRYAKLSYLDKEYRKYNSYIIGGSKSNSFLPGTLNQYIPDASFFSLSYIKGNFFDYETTAHYIIDNYDVRNILLSISISEVSRYKLNQSKKNILYRASYRTTGENKLIFGFESVFVNLSETVKKIKAIKEPDSSQNKVYNEDGTATWLRVQNVMEKNPEQYAEKIKQRGYRMKDKDMSDIGKSLDALKRIKAYCNENNVNLTVIVAPTSPAEISKYDHEKLTDYMIRISEITEFWDFAGENSISDDWLNYYDEGHFTREVGNMVLAKVFNEKSWKVPKDFGQYITQKNAKEHFTNKYGAKMK